MNAILSGPALSVAFGAGGLVVALVLLLRRADSRIEERVQSFAANRGEAGEPEQPRASFWLTLLRRISGAQPTSEDSAARELRKQLQHAGYYAPSALSTCRGVQIVLTLLLAGLSAWTLSLLGADRQACLISTGIGACLGYLLPSLWLRRRKEGRLQILNRSIPDLLDLLVTCLDAGLSLEAVIQRVASELGFAHPLLAGEIARVQREIELGATADRALSNFADRTDCDAVRSLSLVCQQARRFGTKIAAALRSHSDLLREQREQAAEASAQKAAVKILFPTLICLFPVIFVVLAGPAAIQISENFANPSAPAAGGTP